MKKSDFVFIFSSFLIWRIALFIFLFLAIKYVPLQKNFLGGGMENYLKAPWLWAWANFDGEHYLSIAQKGYGFGEQAFFPIYPLFIKFLGGWVWSGLVISHVSFFLALLGLYKLVKLDFSESFSKTAIILLLLFPTSFYFGSVYTESLFLMLSVWSFYFVRQGKWIMAGLIGSLASATRPIGILLLPVLVAEYFSSKNKFKIDEWSLMYLLLIPLGLFLYMYYLKFTTGDWLYFFHSLPSFGEQRSSYPVLLPQVFYRYFFKILPALNFSYFPVLFTTYFELLVAIAFSIFSVIGFFKLRLSYAMYLALGYLVPTLSGSFSSLPRYVLVIFPAFILLSLFMLKLKKLPRVAISLTLFILNIVSFMLFSRGYWIS